MVGENILIDLKHKLEVKTRLHFLQQQLLLYYTFLHEKLTLRQLLHGLILGERESFL